ncbi:hypothetical protein DPMN_032649 [Dreissena polymorpha]|uniref:Uncharacterized protein n=2 Tax=Dreissena polymorpha TaxID=45954 RepID=A0A9D4M296_DREPO|nr:hypothetical protein DPMN_032649 [Dreissena polymorpha]
MRTVAVLAIILVVCYAEECRDVGGCHHVTCATGWHLACRERECTCLTGAAGGSAPNCTLASDCHCDRDTPHCVDGHCMCGFRPGGGK